MSSQDNELGNGAANAAPTLFEPSAIIQSIERAGAYIGVTVFGNGSRQLWVRLPVGTFGTAAVPSLTAAEIVAIADTLIEQDKALFMPQPYKRPGKDS